VIQQRYIPPDWFTQHVFNPAVEAGQFFEGVSADAPDGEIERIALNHPVFRIV
jgi:hypothetical protein